MIVTDLLWAGRIRAEGRAIAFLPFSATEGRHGGRRFVDQVDDGPRRPLAPASPAAPSTRVGCCFRPSPVRAQASSLAAATRPAFGAPPLLAEKLEAGELDVGAAVLEFCARLEAKGFRRVIGADEIVKSLGIAGPIAFIGYAVSEALVQRAPEAVTAFSRASMAAKRLLAISDRAWDAIRPIMQAPDDAVFMALRKRFVEGIPRRSIAEERADSARIYAILADLGGTRLVGDARSLPEDLYWTGA